MAGQCDLHHVRYRKRRCAVVVLQDLDRLADVLFFERFQFEGVDRLKHALQHPFQPSRTVLGIGQWPHHFRQLADRANADFVPVKELLLQHGKDLFGRRGGAVLETTGEEQVFEQGPLGLR